jgi:hypothetical protein
MEPHFQDAVLPAHIWMHEYSAAWLSNPLIAVFP